MEYFVNLPNDQFLRPGKWAKEMESLGWHGVCASDHFWVTHSYPHVFVAATEMACNTEKVKLTTSFCNNLFRSPVEFCQAAFSLQQASSGRFEAGLGAGWLEEELVAAGLEYPQPKERITRYIEALKISREILKKQRCHFDGEFYKISLERVLNSPLYGPPPLVGSAGGPRALKEVSSLVDRVEINSTARATRGGKIDLEIMATIDEDEIKAQIDLVKNVRPDIPVSMFLLVAVGEDKEVKKIKNSLRGGYLGNFVGPPEKVTENLASLELLGIERIQLTEFFPGSHNLLSERLLGMNIN